MTNSSVFLEKLQRLHFCLRLVFCILKGIHSWLTCWVKGQFLLGLADNTQLQKHERFLHRPKCEKKLKSIFQMLISFIKGETVSKPSWRHEKKLSLSFINTYVTLTLNSNNGQICCFWLFSPLDIFPSVGDAFFFFFVAFFGNCETFKLAAFLALEPFHECHFICLLLEF